MTFQSSQIKNLPLFRKRLDCCNKTARIKGFGNQTTQAFRPWRCPTYLPKFFPIRGYLQAQQLMQIRCKTPSVSFRNQVITEQLGKIRLTGSRQGNAWPQRASIGVERGLRPRKAYGEEGTRPKGTAAPKGKPLRGCRRDKRTAEGRKGGRRGDEAEGTRKKLGREG